MDCPAPQSTPELRRSVHRKIDAGLVPGSAPAAVVSELSRGARCTLCEQHIPAGELAFQMHFEPAAEPVRVHVMCYGIWADARTQRSDPCEAGPTTPSLLRQRKDGALRSSRVDSAPWR
jgi:hypothetical protein